MQRKYMIWATVISAVFIGLLSFCLYGIFEFESHKSDLERIPELAQEINTLADQVESLSKSLKDIDLELEKINNRLDNIDVTLSYLQAQ